MPAGSARGPGSGEVRGWRDVAASAGERCGAEWVALGRTLLASGAAERAEVFVGRALQADPGNSEAVAFKLDRLVFRAKAAWDEGDKLQARTLAESALAIDATHALARRVLFLAQDRPMEMLEAIRIGAEHVEFCVVSEQKLFDAHRALIFEIARTLRYEPESK
ncbi:MAG: hypothetical protein L0216_08610 [Planctomycetales bacterium]|nr:hypothetical protein [Planctomycetales bacterium]